MGDEADPQEPLLVSSEKGRAREEGEVDDGRAGHARREELDPLGERRPERERSDDEPDARVVLAGPAREDDADRRAGRV